MVRTAQPFEKCSYLKQVRRLRALAEAALVRYGIRVRKLKFIHHGENATFCVHSVAGRKYLLRILRGGYHTDLAVEAELKWLTHLSRKGFAVPKPFRTKRGELSTFIRTDGIPQGRRCCMFEWLEGSFINKSINAGHMYQAGVLLARLQRETPKGIETHRRYWDSEGLVGKRNPKFGPINKLTGVSAKQQQIILRARKIVFAKLQKYEKKNPRKMGMIHADLHFRNMLLNDGEIAAIDFDDSGFGFYVYDLVIPLISAEAQLGPKRKNEFPNLQAELIRGYAENAEWTDEDEKMIPHMISARRIAMLGWLNSRSDNPRLKKHLKKFAKTAARRLERLYPA